MWPFQEYTYHMMPQMLHRALLDVKPAPAHWQLWMAPAGYQLLPRVAMCVRP